MALLQQVSANQSDVLADPRRRWLIVAILTGCLALSYLDRQLIAIVVDPLRRSLDVTDVQIGLAQGLAFTGCATIAGVGMAWIVDRWNRSLLIAICIAIWSTGAMACGLATNFWQFLLARSVVAIGEAGLTPAMISICTDLFRRQDLPRANAMLMTGSYFGTALALFFGGWLLDWLQSAPEAIRALMGDMEPWRLLFLLAGIPGVFAIVAVLLIIREPPRSEVSSIAEETRSGDIRQVLNAKNRFLVFYLFATMLLFLVFFAQVAWAPTILIRVHEISPGRAGAMLGPAFLASGLLGSGAVLLLVRGVSADQMMARIMSIVFMVGIGLLTGSLILAFSKTLLVAVLGYCLAAFSAGVLVAMSPLPVQLVSPNKLRGMMIAVIACFYSVGSAGGGPLAIAAITDHVFRDSLRIGDSLAIVAVVAVVCGLALLLEGRRRLNREPEAASPPTPSRSP